LVPVDLQAAMRFGNIKRTTPGDVVIIRTGWTHLFGTDPALRDRYIGREPGIYLREARWLARFRPAIIASDAPALEVLPAPAPWTETQFFSVHQELLTHHGIRIGEAFRSEDLAADRVYEFVLLHAAAGEGRDGIEHGASRPRAAELPPPRRRGRRGRRRATVMTLTTWRGHLPTPPLGSLGLEAASTGIFCVFSPR
jgi:hypothetical protein